MGLHQSARREGETDSDGDNVRSRGEGEAGRMGDPLQGSQKGIGLVQVFRGKEKADSVVRKPLTMRWHVMAGMALLHGYRNGVELGVSGGRFTMFLCATIQDLTMRAVDLWQEQPDNTVEGGQTYVGWDHEKSYKNFRNGCDLFFADRVTINRMSTIEAANLVEDVSVDFVFIDADHSYEGCKNDIMAWGPKVRSGGMIAGHDYNWPTVKQAVDETGMKITTWPDNVWVHIKP